MPKSQLSYGAGTLTFVANHYRGSDQTKTYVLPLPFIRYRSKTIEADNSMVRGTFFDSDFFQLKLSFMLGLAVESQENTARAGMSNLDWTIEAGPMAIIKLWTSSDKTQSLTIEVPIRQILATDLTYLTPQGIFAVPYLNYIVRPSPFTYNIGGEFSLAAMYGSAKFHDYFYGVSPQFVTPTRELYKAKAGYSGFQATLILNYQYKDLVLIPFARYDNLSSVAFRDSPLFLKNEYFVAGTGIFYLFQ